MKKNIILVFVLLLAPLHVMAQPPDWKQSLITAKTKPSWNEVKGSFVLLGEYNFLEKTPRASASINCDIGYIRGSIDMGWSYISQVKHNNHFNYVAFSVGPLIGQRTKFYAQIGMTTWAGFSKTDFYSDFWHCQAKIGTDIYLSKICFLNIGANYIFPNRNNSNITHSELCSLQTGLGFRF